MVTGQRLLAFSLLLLQPLALSCTDDPTSSSGDYQLNESLLAQSWVNSYEEEGGAWNTDSSVYRPQGYREFEASRFRMRLSFFTDGTCEWLVLHPADAHYMKQGRWEADSEDARVIWLFDDNDGPWLARSLRIVRLRSDRLVIIWGETIGSDA